MPAEYNKALIIADFEAGILDNAKDEFRELIWELGGNEKIADAAQYLFGGCEKLKGNHRQTKELIWVIVEVFRDLTEEFAEYINYDANPRVVPTGERTGVEELFDVGDNLSLSVGQMVRYLDLLYCMRALNGKGDYDRLFEHSEDLKRFIYSKTPDWTPSDKYPDQAEWCNEFKHITKMGRIRKLGFEPYLATQLSETVRKMSNKIRHRDAFPKRFKTEIPFYDDYFIILSMYVTAVLAFIEILEAWVNIKPYFEEHRGELT